MSVANVINEIELAPDAVANFKALGIKADVIAESTPATGVTIDGVLSKDGGVTATALSVFTKVTVSDTLLKTGGDKTLAIVIADANYTVLAVNSGKIHLVANVSADRTFTLPAVDPGLYYEFWSTMEAADGHDWLIVTGSDTNFYKGGVIFLDSDVGGAASEVILSAPNGTDDATIQINLPSVGTCVKMYCDGTNWFLSGVVFSTTAPTFT